MTTSQQLVSLTVAMFDTQKCSEDIILSEDNHVATKQGDTKYHRAVMGTRALVGRKYFEVCQNITLVFFI